MADLVGLQHVFRNEEGLQLHQHAVHRVGTAPLDLTRIAVPNGQPPPASMLVAFKKKKKLPGGVKGGSFLNFRVRPQMLGPQLSH